jgi:hypothetical protein
MSYLSGKAAGVLSGLPGAALGGYSALPMPLPEDDYGVGGGLGYSVVDGSTPDLTRIAAEGDIPCQGFSGGCQGGGTRKTTAMYSIGGRLVCHQCAVKLLGIGSEPGGDQVKILRPFLMGGK